MLFNKCDNVVLESSSIYSFNGLSKNIEGARRGAKIPPTKGDDLLDCVGHGLEAVKLVLSTANINVEGRGNISKGKMYVRIQCCINVIHIHM